jgi:hypothetical protein
MKCETALRRILESDNSDKVKAMQLWKLAARQLPGSYNQELVRKHWEIYYKKVKEETT